MLHHALEWSIRGARVIPLHNPANGACSCGNTDCPSPAKHPRTANGLKDASADPDVITDWWQRWPHANIGVLTGDVFDVIDLDGKPAIDAWRQHVDAIGANPETVGMAVSGRTTGGLHLYTLGGGMKTVPSGKRGLPPGVEIKGVGGYVVAPGSTHITGATYRWVNDYGVISGDTPWTDWYSAHITAPPAPAQGATFTLPPDSGADTTYGQAILRNACERLAATPEGARHDTLVGDTISSVARAVNGGAIADTDGAAAAIQQAARACGLDETEVSRIPTTLADFIRQGSTKPLTSTPLPDPEPLGTFTPTTGGDDAEGGAERTSWWPRDIAATIAGEHAEPDPEHLRRDDGHALAYIGRVNGIIGESESGKTWLALLATRQALQHGQAVLYLDFEDSAVGVIGRLLLMGCTSRQLAHLTYISPDESLHPGARADLSEAIASHTPRLVIVDGFNAAMTLLGFEVNSNSDATAFSQQLLKPLAATGAAVIYVDHVPKSKEARGKGGIGAQAKRAMTTGCALLAEVLDQPGKGRVGKLRLTVDKDRPGLVREKSSGGNLAGVVIIDGTDPERVAVTVEAPDLRPADERGPFRPTARMQEVSILLEGLPGGASKAQIEANVPGRRDVTRSAVDALVAEGYAILGPGARNAIVAKSVAPYREEGVQEWQR